MKANFDSGYTDVITEDSNPHDVAAIFKEFLRCLPDPLLTRDLYPAFLAAASKSTTFSLFKQNSVSLKNESAKKL